MPGFFVCLRRTVCPTPTCVGNTMRCPRCPRLPSVHPHMRGEYQAVRPCVVDNVGSSPHAWGIRPDGPSPDSQRRFIPTCVGNTAAGSLQMRHGAVHPHMRGEYPARACSRRQHGGSSPHAWGIRDAFRHLHALQRFIPTCVGNTAMRSPSAAAGSVHPHMRGEYSTHAGLFRHHHGSSPHAWGIPRPAGGGQG